MYTYIYVYKYMFFLAIFFSELRIFFEPKSRRLHSNTDPRKHIYTYYIYIKVGNKNSKFV